MSASLFPGARHTQLVVETLNDEILIYDLDNAQASCLNPTAALVWKYADGKTSVSDIAKKMSSELGTIVDPRVVWYALEQLDKKHLLAEPVKTPAQYQHISRRDFLMKAGIVGAAVAVPVVIALTAPSPAMAATCVVTCGSNPDCAGQVSPCTTTCTSQSGVPGSGTCTGSP